MEDIRLARTDREILSCHPAMRELRDSLGEDEFLKRVRSQEKYGYKLAYTDEADAFLAFPSSLLTLLADRGAVFAVGAVHADPFRQFAGGDDGPQMPPRDH